MERKKFTLCPACSAYPEVEITDQGFTIGEDANTVRLIRRADMWAGIGVRAAQADGSPPTAFAAGSARGESGVSVRRARFHGGMHLEATPQRHCVCFHMPRCALSAAWPVGRFGERAWLGNSISVRPASIVVSMPTRASKRFLSRSIPAGSPSLPQRNRRSKRS